MTEGENGLLRALTTFQPGIRINWLILMNTRFDAIFEVDL